MRLVMRLMLVLTVFMMLLALSAVVLGHVLSGGVLAVTVSMTEKRDIYLVDTGGGRVFRLSEGSDWYGAPVWSPDGSMLAYGYDSELYVIDSVGGAPRNLSLDRYAFDFDPAWSPDSQWIAWQSRTDNLPDIRLMNLSDGHVRNLTDVEPPAANYDRLSFSPDGTRLAAVKDHQDNTSSVVVFDLDDVAIDRFDPTFGSVYNLNWSPDGRTLLLAASLELEPADIYTLSSDGGALRNLTNNPASDYGSIWSPNGRQIAFMTNRNGTFDIFVMDSDGTNIRSLASDISMWRHLTWSPNSSEIAFIVVDGISQELYLVNVDSGVTRQLTNGQFTGIVEPAWKP